MRRVALRDHGREGSLRLRALLLWLGAAAAVLGPGAASALPDEGIPHHEAESSILGTVASGDEGALGATFNPAQWGVLGRGELDFWWSDRDVRKHALDSWGLAFGKRLGFSARRHDFLTTDGPHNLTDYQIGLGGGGGGRYAGIAYGWSGGDDELVGRSHFLTLGSIHRPARWLSYGSTARFAFGNRDREGVVDVAVRPLLDPRLVLFADYAVRRGQQWDEGALAGGVAVRPIPGLAAAFKLRERGAFQLALGVGLGRLGAQALPSYDSDGDRTATNFVIRSNPPLAGFDLDGHVFRGRRALEMNLNGQAVYQGYRFGDERSLALRDLTERIRFATEDPTVAAVAINLSGFEANSSMLWEIREKLAELRRSGKRVVVYCDRLTLSTLYFAVAADYVIMDPQGMLLMPGVQASRTYLKDLLGKIGIGFDEWRFFKYKSAMETYSRRSMSEADREQRQALVDGYYDELARGIVGSGRTTRARLDSLVSARPLLLPDQLLALGWIDRVGHWEDVREALRTTVGHRVALVSHRKLRLLRERPEEEWGEPPIIALVYAVGDCAMDTGIRGRATSGALRRFRRSSNVKAVVLRADSPGGDPLPSDLVAHELRRLREVRKPVFVSQGRVAASGGYWISMDADTISTSPFTVTGSIGVIGGWFWNMGLGKKLGLTSDRVQQGPSADLLGGLTLPLVGITIPERNLDDDERRLARETILAEYDDFVSRVAAARKLEVGYVRGIAEGHVYTGRRGIELRIVDRLATLDQTIAAAKRAAGLSEKRRVRVVEYPRAPLFRWPSFLPPLAFGRARDAAAPAADPARSTYEWRALQWMLRNPGRPLPLTPPSLLPDEVVPF